MNDRYFTFLITADSGKNVFTAAVNSRFILRTSIVLTIAFLLALVPVIGYHVKLHQDKQYQAALKHHRELLNRLHEAEKHMAAQSEKIQQIKEKDISLRHIAQMKHIEDSMYEAGIGGHTIVDTAKYASLDGRLKDDLIFMETDMVMMDSRLRVLDSSMLDITKKIRQNCEMIDSTPTILPALYTRITSGFGWRIHPITGRKEFHRGIDLRADIGEPVYATADGMVVASVNDRKLGKCVIIQHKYGYRTLYGHMDSINTTSGQMIEKGEVIGTVGNTGRATGVHLHYGLYLNGEAQNPLDYF